MAVRTCVREPCGRCRRFWSWSGTTVCGSRRVRPHGQRSQRPVPAAAGTLGDRGEAHWLAPAGLVTAAVGMAAVGFVDELPLTLVVAVCAAGVAAYHPRAHAWRGRRGGRGDRRHERVFGGGGLGYAWASCGAAVLRRWVCTAPRWWPSCRWWRP